MHQTSSDQLPLAYPDYWCCRRPGAGDECQRQLFIELLRVCLCSSCQKWQLPLLCTALLRALQHVRVPLSCWDVPLFTFEWRMWPPVLLSCWRLLPENGGVRTGAQKLTVQYPASQQGGGFTGGRAIVALCHLVFPYLSPFAIFKVFIQLEHRHGSSILLEFRLLNQWRLVDLIHLQGCFARSDGQEIPQPNLFALFQAEVIQAISAGALSRAEGSGSGIIKLPGIGKGIARWSC